MQLERRQIHTTSTCDPADSRERPASPARRFHPSYSRNFFFNTLNNRSRLTRDSKMEKLKALAALAFWLIVVGYVIWGCLTGKSDWKDK